MSGREGTTQRERDAWGVTDESCEAATQGVRKETEVIKWELKDKKVIGSE